MKPLQIFTMQSRHTLLLRGAASPQASPTTPKQVHTTLQGSTNSSRHVSTGRWDVVSGRMPNAVMFLLTWPAGASKATESACPTRASASNQAVMSFQLSWNAHKSSQLPTGKSFWRHWGSCGNSKNQHDLSVWEVKQEISGKRQYAAMIWNDQVASKNVTTALSNCILADSQQPVHSVLGLLRKKLSFSIGSAPPVFRSGHWLWAEQLTFPTRWTWLT